MKRKALKYPYSWENRKVLIQDRVWFVPQDCPNDGGFEFPGWSSPDLFGNDLPVRVEYCSGNGEWIAKKAEEDPSSNWVAVEIKFERVRSIWAKIKRKELNNLIVIFGEGCHTTSRYFPDSSIKETFINFPDPWPKRRHAKHRIVQDPFVEQIARVLQPEGTLSVVTDDQDYSDIIVKVMKKHPIFLPPNQAAPYLTHLEGYGTSFFDKLWREKGKEIRYHIYLKQKAVI